MERQCTGELGTYKSTRAVRDPNSLGRDDSWLLLTREGVAALQGRDPPHAARTGLLSLPRAHHTAKPAASQQHACMPTAETVARALGEPAAGRTSNLVVPSYRLTLTDCLRPRRMGWDGEPMYGSAGALTRYLGQ